MKIGVAALKTGLLATFLLITPFATAQEASSDFSHGLSIFGALKYPPDFRHFDYVNPNAPKGGELSTTVSRAAYNGGFRQFDSLNGYILKGQSAAELFLLFDSLMVRAYDEPDAVYGLLAEKVQRTEEGAIFILRKSARFADGAPVLAEDVAFSLNLLKEKGHPLIGQNLRRMVSASALASDKVEIRLEADAPKSLLLFIATLPVFSKAYYTAHDFSKTTLEPPLGSGPYAVEKIEVGRTIIYRRRADYWGKNLPVNRGMWNFDTIRFEYFRDDTASFEAFSSGEYRLREEFVSKQWATRYNFPAFKRGEVKKLLLPDGQPSGAQGWFLNMRREKFQHPSLRAALALAFDFPWTNKHLFHDLYTRTESFFENSPMKAEGLPSAAEKAMLDAAGASVPKTAYGEALLPPRTNGSGQDRVLLRRAQKLLEEAGWQSVDGVRRNAKGEALEIEFLLLIQGFERITAPLIKNLKLLGIESKMRLVDPAQYQERLKRFDFDITTSRFTIANTPGPELRPFFAASEAAQEGSRNLSGIADPAVDYLVEQVIFAPSREKQIIAAKALDRVLRALHVWIPQWHKPSHSIAFWQGYQRPPQKPPFRRAIIETWWAEEKPQ